MLLPTSQYMALRDCSQIMLIRTWGWGRKNYEKLELKFDNYEAQNRGNTLIISGKEVPSFNSNENCLSLVKNLIHNKLNLSIHEQSVVSAHRLGSPPSTQRPDKRNILVRLTDETSAQTIVKASKTVKPSSLFFSENLIQKRHTILQILRRLKRAQPNKISGCAAIRGRFMRNFRCSRCQDAHKYTWSVGGFLWKSARVVIRICSWIKRCVLKMLVS